MISYLSLDVGRDESLDVAFCLVASDSQKVSKPIPQPCGPTRGCQRDLSPTYEASLHPHPTSVASPPPPSPPLPPPHIISNRYSVAHLVDNDAVPLLCVLQRCTLLAPCTKLLRNCPAIFQTTLAITLYTSTSDLPQVH